MNSDFSLVETESISGPLRSKMKFDEQLFEQFPYQYVVINIVNSMEQRYFSEDNGHLFSLL
jgi:hypothetical protein